MATRTEDRLGAAKDVGTTYVNVGTVPASTTFNAIVRTVCHVACSVRLYIAANSWTTGEPTGSDLVAKLAYDRPMVVGEVIEDTGIILETGEKLIARASAAGVDVLAHGVAIT